MTRNGETLRRSYDEGCIAAHALDLIGDRWALLVVRELMLGPKRFTGLRAGLPGLSANILTRRLTLLEEVGVLKHKALPPPASVQVYELTPAGHALWPVLRAFCRWGAAMPGHDPRLFISPTALMLSMRAMVNADSGPEVAAGFKLAGEIFLARMGGGRYRVRRAEALDGDLRLEGTGNTMAAAIYGPTPLGEAVAAGVIGFSGDIRLGQAFVDCFSLKR